MLMTSGLINAAHCRGYDLARGYLHDCPRDFRRGYLRDFHRDYRHACCHDCAVGDDGVAGVACLGLVRKLYQLMQ
jgi:hypothetical protein